jgi:hypothetical protein
MVEATDAKDMIDDAIDRAEAERDVEARTERAAERRFRDRVSLLVGGFAVSLAVVHMAAAGDARESTLKGIAASDTFAYMQAKIVRETVLKTAAQGHDADAADRGQWTAEARRLRAPDRAGHGIGQLQSTGDALRRDGMRAAQAGAGYEIGETALQLAIVLLSIALIARSRAIDLGACGLAGAGVLIAITTAAGVSLPIIGTIG